MPGDENNLQLVEQLISFDRKFGERERVRAYFAERTKKKKRKKEGYSFYVCEKCTPFNSVNICSTIFEQL